MHVIYFPYLTKGLAEFFLVIVYKEFNVTKYHKIFISSLTLIPIN